MKTSVILRALAMGLSLSLSVAAVGAEPQLVTIWYLLITPLPAGESPNPYAYKTFEVETVDFASKDDCATYAAANNNLQLRLDEKYPPALHPAIIGATQCFSRVVRR